MYCSVTSDERLIESRKGIKKSAMVIKSMDSLSSGRTLQDFGLLNLLYAKTAV